MKKVSEIVIDYADRECVNCGKLAFIPLWVEEKDVQYFSSSFPAESVSKRFTGLQGAI